MHQFKVGDKAIWKGGAVLHETKKYDKGTPVEIIRVDMGEYMRSAITTYSPVRAVRIMTLYTSTSVTSMTDL